MRVDQAPMKRPSTKDEFVRRRAAEIVLPDVMRWCGGDVDECTVMHDLMSIVHEHDDGFRFVRSLEKLDWQTVDDSLVQILGEGWVTTAIEELTDQWVRCYQIEPQFAIGDAVTAQIGGREETGTIVKIDARLAQYGVRTPGQSEKQHYVVKYEHVHAIAQLEVA